MRVHQPILAIVITAASAAADSPPAVAQESPPVAVQPSRPSATAVSRLVLTGAAGGVTGFVAGTFLIGAPLAYWNPFNSDALDDDLRTPGFAIGFVGVSTAIPEPNAHSLV
jgi:hypothetical protein